MESIWTAVKATLREQVPGHSYRMWIEPVELLRFTPNAVVLGCPNMFSKKRVLEHYGSLIEGEFSRLLGKACRVLADVVRSDPRPAGEPRMDRQLPLPNLMAQPHSGRLLRKDFTFDQFVVGGNNDFAYSAALSLAAKRNRQQTALFLLSKTGMGKSHLSQAVGHHILSKFPTERVYYVTAEDFTNEMVGSIRNDCIGRFKEKYRQRCDVLLLEDVHYLTGKERTQTELALTLDSLFESDKKIIFSSCYLPGEIPRLNEKLRSRFSSSIISGIDPPDFRTRLRILQKKIKTNAYVMSEEVTHFLASELTENVRQLESGLVGVVAKSSLLGIPIDLSLAEGVVKNISLQRKTITVESIKKLVCKHFKISVDDIVSKSRKQSAVRPRQIAMYLSRIYTDAPLQEIGRRFNRYHATALHSIGAVEKELKANNALQEQVQFFRKKLESGGSY